MRFTTIHARARLARGLALLTAATLAGCAASPPQHPAPAGRTDAADAADAATERTLSLGDVVAELAMGQVGVPYRYGGADPREGFDCSGLVFYTYARAGLEVPRTSQELFKSARKIALREVNAGDLMFFQDQEKLSHVGIYVGDGLFVHAPASGRTVSVASIDSPYYRQHLVAVGRLLPN
ncbi:MAG TPA: C40 family peptidase [Gammaproteobacteria bacterium]